ncbi:MAG: ABC transporter ATP-binding protein [Planctomycetes bacterium]|nr:ABC transporter ATP-binding protein [Planctomycetota bacterium]
MDRSEGDDFLRLIRRMLAYVSGHRRLIGFALLSMLIHSLCRNYPILVIDDLLEEVFSQGHSAAETSRELWRVSLQMLAAAIIGSVTFVLNEYFFKWISTQVLVAMRSELMDHLLSLPLRFFNKERMGDLVSRITNDVQVTYRTLNILLSEIVLLPFMALSALAMAFTLSWQLGLLTLPVLALVIWPVLRLGSRVKRRSRRGLESLGETTEVMLQTISGVRTIKAFRAETIQYERFQAANEVFRRRNLKLARTKAVGRGVMDTAYWLAITVAVLVGGHLALAGTWGLTGAKLVAYLTAMMLVYRPLKRLAAAYNGFQESLAASARIFEILDLPRADEHGISGSRIDHIGDVVVRGLRFGYESDRQRALEDIDLEIRAGETVALVGPSGAGKSTLADLIAGFYRPDEGEILVDGRELWTIDRGSYLARIALVSQSPFVFNTSIRDNILFGRPGASQEEVEEAARAANIHDMITALPEGYDTVVGERGVSLSGGQLQRLTIARAVLRNADFLILDEATSALDTMGEKLVQEALDRLSAQRTTLVIAHRLSTIRRADRIVVLDQGRIREIGRHEELLDRGGLYAELHAMQAD